MTDTPDAPPVVLVVEDERSLRELMVCAFNDTGWACIAAATAAAAREESRTARRVTLLVADLGVARAGGTNLLDEISQAHPGLGTVVISGNANQILELQRANRRSDAAYLAKPFSIDELLATARDVVPYPLPG